MAKSSDMLGTLKGLLGDNADEKINAVMNALKNSSNNSGNGGSVSDNINSVVNSVNDSIEVNDERGAIPVSFSSDNNGGITQNANNLLSPEGLEYISKIKGIIDEMGSANDPRSNLLMSLRPYMRTNRQRSIDNAVKILNLSRFSGLFKI